MTSLRQFRKQAASWQPWKKSGLFAGHVSRVGKNPGVLCVVVERDPILSPSNDLQLAYSVEYGKLPTVYDKTTKHAAAWSFSNCGPRYRKEIEGSSLAMSRLQQLCSQSRECPVYLAGIHYSHQDWPHLLMDIAFENGLTREHKQTKLTH